MIRFRRSATFLSAALNKRKRLLKGSTYSDMGVDGEVFARGWRLFEAWCLLKEILYPRICQGRVAWWLATCARKPKVPGSSPAASYVQR